MDRLCSGSKKGSRVYRQRWESKKGLAFLLLSDNMNLFIEFIILFAKLTKSRTSFSQDTEFKDTYLQPRVGIADIYGDPGMSNSPILGNSCDV